MSSLFSRIISREVPAHIVAESKKFIAFLDINPLREGHTLVVPKVEVDYIFDQSDDVLSGLLIFAKNVAKQIQTAVPCSRIGLAVVGLEVPHTHLHLVPIDSVSDMDFSRPKLKLSQEALTACADCIRAVAQ